ncbi:hypothetical protein PG996_011424 [Apiospora saccharicola]|uniref:Chitin-binding type-2 domain-containing protein n=1 Tax=Apiospora saccharicola TaxID=335842 RepID=A0ABR1UFK3_9PEZI
MRFQFIFMLLPLLGSTPLTSASPTGMGVSSSSSSSPLSLLESRQSGTCKCPEPEGVFPNPCSCDQYIQCTNDIPLIGVCNFNERFDSESRGCIPEGSARCAAEQDCCSS